MEEKKIRQYAKILNETGLTALEVRSDGTVRLERHNMPLTNVVASDSHSTRCLQNVPVGDPKDSDTDESLITSPMVGMFYSSPAENADSFVQVGSKVCKGDVLCIIEAMKLMNEITADCDGVITEILAANGSIVEFGQHLFRLRKELHESGAN